VQGDADAIRPARKFAKFVDYNMSSMTDTKGGFLSTEDDPHNYAMGVQKTGQEEEQRPKHMTIQEWERLKLIRSLDKPRPGQNPTVVDEQGKRKTCKECNNMDIDWVWEEVFHICVCKDCKEKYPEKYSLLTKTECKEDYLLTDRKSILQTSRGAELMLWNSGAPGSRTFAASI
jgi:DNA-repair protein complementing XP-A cells